MCIIVNNKRGIKENEEGGLQYSSKNRGTIKNYG